MNSSFNKSLLDCGATLVTEKMDSAASVALGLWVAAGSRDEGPAENGLAHLIEHMVFKGTPSRDKLSIAREMDRQGGQANAFTTRENTCFHTRVRPADLPKAIELLVDIFQNSLYDDEELALEKQVILQEIAMVEDEPEELVHDLKTLAAWPGHPLGRPVAGTLESVEALSRDMILGWLCRHWVGPRVLISAAGAVDHRRLADHLNLNLKLGPSCSARELSTPRSRFGLRVRRRALEQSHLVVGSDFPAAGDERRYAAALLNLVLGGNMSSRLFQEVRERRGLAYSVYSAYTPYQGLGMLEIYAAAAPKNMPLTYGLILDELDKLGRIPLKGQELKEAAEALKTGLILGGESPEGRMSSLAKNELTFGRPISLADSCQALDNVQPEEIQALARTFWAPDRYSVFALGPVKKKDFEV